MKQNVFFSLIISIFCASFCISEELSSQTADWTAVISGKAVCTPCQTSYGMAVLTDGKMITACSNSGKILWERPVPGHPEPLLTVFSSDFLLTVSDKKNLSLVNPSGLTLWTAKIPFQTEENPVTGRDSRILVKGKKNIACYGVNGICKWCIETPDLKNGQLYEMNDGSFLVFLETSKSEKSKAIRINPFGEIIENINFSYEIISAKSCDSGLLLSMKTGEIAFCAVSGENTVTKWWIPYKDKAFSNTKTAEKSFFLVLSENRGCVAVSGENCTRIAIFSLSDGHISDFFDIQIPFENLKLFSKTSNQNEIVAASNTKCLLSDTTGKLKLEKDFPKTGDIFSKWNEIFFSDQDSLLLCSTSWAIGSFKLTQNLKNKSVTKHQKKSYENYYEIDKNHFYSADFMQKIDSTITGNNRKKELLQGNYGFREKKYISALLTFENAYRSYLFQSNSRPKFAQQSIFERDSESVENIILQMNSFGTNQFIKTLAFFIRNEKSDANLSAVFRSIAECGFDPEDQIFSAIDYRIKKMPAAKSDVIIAMCDAIYEICRFMGRPAFYSHGLEILTSLFYPQYDNSVHEYARKTLTKIASLKI